VKNDSLAISFFSSLAIHVLALLLGSFFVHQSTLSRPQLITIRLLDLSSPELPPPPQTVEAQREVHKPRPPPPAKPEKALPSPPIAKTPIAKPEVPTQPVEMPGKEEPTKPVETKPAAPAKLEPPPSYASGGRGEGGGSEAGIGHVFGKGDVGIVPGTGTAGGGGGTAASGLGRGSGTPGLPAQPVLRANREAKPIQTVRAAYPPMALRAGLESDVTLKIEIDTEGKVTRAEIIKSGGAGFDEEALKAVKQSRFEPAQRDGHQVPAEFTYIYRFRLRR
jgi:protein TonB